MKRVAIIGAGISGLTLAQELSAKAQVTVYEKARGVGGRMATRYADPFYFDHGAQFFTARTTDFQAFLNPYVEDGTVREWSGDTINLEAGKKEDKYFWSEPHWVACPNMNNLCKAMSKNLDVRTSCEVKGLSDGKERSCKLIDKDGSALGDFDWVISTAPPEQTLRLFGKYVHEKSSLHSAKMQGCFSLMIGLHEVWSKSWIAAKCHNSPIQSIFVNSSKPGRNKSVTSLVVHSANDWAQKHIDDDVEEVKFVMSDELSLLTGIMRQAIANIDIHRWRYAVPESGQALKYQIDNNLGLASVGDWCGSARIEDVWLKARKCAAQLSSEVDGT